MVARRDSTPAAAEAVLEIEKRCKKGGVGEALPEVMLVCTVGEFQIFPGATNVIGSRTTFSVDIRAQSDRVRKNVVQDVTRKVQLICRAWFRVQSPAHPRSLWRDHGSKTDETTRRRVRSNDGRNAPPCLRSLHGTTTSPTRRKRLQRRLQRRLRRLQRRLRWRRR